MNIKKYFLNKLWIFIFSIALLVASRGQTLWAEGTWQEVKGDHFIVFYQTQESFSREVSRKAETYYRRISEDLGYSRYSNFWQWENRVKIFIYPTREAFLDATGRRGWSEGAANYTTKEIASYAEGKNFLDGLLPHEITHLIFRDYVGFKGEIPLWLDEGVAQWQEEGKRGKFNRLMKGIILDNRYFTMKELTEVDIRKATYVPAVQVFYMQSVSLIDFLVSEYGTDGFVTFCHQLRDGKSLDEALTFAYPTSIRNTNE